MLSSRGVSVFSPPPLGHVLCLVTNISPATLLPSLPNPPAKSTHLPITRSKKDYTDRTGFVMPPLEISLRRRVTWGTSSVAAEAVEVLDRRPLRRLLWFVREVHQLGFLVMLSLQLTMVRGSSSFHSFNFLEFPPFCGRANKGWVFIAFGQMGSTHGPVTNCQSFFILQGVGWAFEGTVRLRPLKSCLGMCMYCFSTYNRAWMPGWEATF